MFLKPIDVPGIEMNDIFCFCAIINDQNPTWYSLKSNSIQTEARQFADLNLPLKLNKIVTQIYSPPTGSRSYLHQGVSVGIPVYTEEEESLSLLVITVVSI